MKKEKKKAVSALKCFECNELIYRTHYSNAYQNLTSHYEQIHSIDIRDIQQNPPSSKHDIT